MQGITSTNKIISRRHRGKIKVDFLQGFLTITAIHILAAASPGPDFVMVSQQSLTNGRRAGILCSLGIALGLSVHILYSSIGMAALVSESSYVLSSLKLLAAFYLIYLGVKGLRSQPDTAASADLTGAKRLSSWKLISLGFICNALNPKAPLYFLSVFTLVLSPDMPMYQLFLMGGWMMVVQFGWFSLVALLLSKSSVKNKFHAIGHWVNRAMGSVMLVFGLRLLISKFNS